MLPRAKNVPQALKTSGDIKRRLDLLRRINRNANTEKATEITAMTGDKLSISIEGDTSYVSIGDQKAQILIGECLD